MIFQSTIKTGKLIIKDIKVFNNFLKTQNDGEYTIEIKKYRKTRSCTQNRSLHLWFTKISKALNNAGFGVLKVLRIDVPWNSTLAKELLWRNVQIAHTGKKSTTQLNTHEIDQIFDIVSKAISEQAKVYEAFPCEESLIEQENEEYGT